MARPRYDSRNKVISWNVGVRNCGAGIALMPAYTQRYAGTSSGGSLAVGGSGAGLTHESYVAARGDDACSKEGLYRVANANWRWANETACRSK